MSNAMNRARDAIRYNQVLAEAAEKLLESGELTDPEIRKWVQGVAKQHRFHEKRFRNTLAKLESKRAETAEESAEAEVNKSIEEQQAEQKKAEAQG